MYLTNYTNYVYAPLQMGFLRKYVKKAAQPNLHEWHQEATEAWRGTLLLGYKVI
jgi:hypothetical protein